MNLDELDALETLANTRLPWPAPGQRDIDDQVRAAVPALVAALRQAWTERDAAFARGAEAMREAAIEVARKRADLPATSDTDAAWCRSAQCIVDELRGLAVSEDK
jgi:hypothetical protein